MILEKTWRSWQGLLQSALEVTLQQASQSMPCVFVLYLQCCLHQSHLSNERGGHQQSMGSKCVRQSSQRRGGRTNINRTSNVLGLASISIQMAEAHRFAGAWGPVQRENGIPWHAQERGDGLPLLCVQALRPALLNGLRNVRNLLLLWQR